MRKHKLEIKGYSYGLISFCERKKLNLIHVVNLFLSDNGKEIKSHSEKQDFIDSNWHKFAAWVNNKLTKGEISGDNVSTSNGSQERKALIRHFYAEQPLELRQWFENLKNKSQWSTGQEQVLSTFFHKYGLGLIPKKTDAELNVAKQYSRFEAIKKAGLLEEFKNYEFK